MHDPFAEFKEMQRRGWPHFVPVEAHTTQAAAQLVRRAGVRSGQRVLDVACGTGVVALTAARLGANVTGLDLTPELLERARENAAIAQTSIEFLEGDAEALPFGDGAFDVVLSQFGHIFAPRPDVALSEMLRVLRPGGTVAFSTWPPHTFVGRTFTLLSRYLPPPPKGVVSPALWGEPDVVGKRFDGRVTDVVFDTAIVLVGALSPQHHELSQERTIGPVVTLVEKLTTSDPATLVQFRKEYEAVCAEYFFENAVALSFLVTRAKKI
ncbi:MAG: class I SAM-dependent methyltransferase [Candidatus Tyrphobacter sp.]